MATYKGIQGYSVQKLSEDPTLSEAVGQLWYNSSTGKFKIASQGAGAWAAGGNLNTARRGIAVGGAGTRDTALSVSGDSPSKPNVEEYDGTSWTEVADVLTARANAAAAGTQTAALFMGGNPASSLISETWNGTSWTETNDINMIINMHKY